MCLQVCRVMMLWNADEPMLYRRMSATRWPYLPVYSLLMCATVAAVSLALFTRSPLACLCFASLSAALSVLVPTNR